MCDCKCSCSCPDTPDGFDPSKPVKTLAGWSARILATDLKGPGPIAAAINNHSGEQIFRYTADGKCMGVADFGYHLMNVPEVVVRYRNLYAPACTTSSEDHNTFGEAKSVSGDCKSKCIGTAKLTYTDGKLTDVELVNQL